jgi:hypothetical protein
MGSTHQGFTLKMSKGHPYGAPLVSWVGRIHRLESIGLFWQGGNEEDFRLIIADFGFLMGRANGTGLKFTPPTLINPPFVMKSLKGTSKN